MTLPTTDEMLAQVPIFASLSDKDRRAISNLATRIDLPDGSELARQGAAGNEFIVVLRGLVDVVIDGKVVASLGSGKFFGEVALLEHRPRTATVVARGPVILDVINRPEFVALLDDHPEIETELRATLAERLLADELRHASDGTAEA